MFELTKLQQTILYILQRANSKGVSSLTRFQLMKFVYLIQVESQKYTGDSFLPSLRFFREKNGPLSKQIYEACDLLQINEYINIKEIPNTEYGYPRHEHTLNREDIVYTITQEEMIFLNSILDDYVTLSHADLKDIVYSTEPMRKILKIEEQEGLKRGMPLDMETISLDQDVLESLFYNEL